MPLPAGRGLSVLRMGSGEQKRSKESGEGEGWEGNLGHGEGPGNRAAVRRTGKGEWRTEALSGMRGSKEWVTGKGTGNRGALRRTGKG